MENYRDKLDKVVARDMHHILVAPLNWGLGHATRSIPIINHLIDQGKEVTIASDGEALELLQDEFPSLNSIQLPSYNVRYNSTTLWSILVTNVPNVLKAIIAEYFTLKRYTKNKNIDLIISDSRFGFRHSSIRSYIISHQLTMQSNNSIIKWVLNFVNQKLLNAFDLCIVPDYDDHRLSGALSKNDEIKEKLYIGTLSRFKKLDVEIKYDKAYIISGPEPARKELQNHILNKIRNTDKKTVLVRGTNSGEIILNNPNVTILDLVSAEVLNQIIAESQIIISRSGYTSIMDYYTLGKDAKLIPTPGQSEQEYLADYLDGKYGLQKVSLHNCS